jgi:NADH-quinone oxidoreductase subunit M
VIPTILILLPIGAALTIWIVPWSTSRAAGGFALLVALGELALWVGTALNFDFGASGLQEEVDVTWFADLDVSYQVGFYDYSLWLVGLTAVVTATAVGYGFWTGRERLGVYLSLLLFLEGATVGVFASQDLVLFYVFWEAMLIPLYVLIGVWGGPGRLGATYKFVAYTVAGSLLMLVAIIATGLDAGTFDMTQLGGQGTSTWIFLGFAAAFAVKAPLWPFHGWLPDAYRESPPEVAAVLSGVTSKTAAYGFLAIAIPFYPGPAEDWRTPILVLASIGLVYGSLLAFRAPDVRGVIAYSSLAQMNLIVIGIFAVNASGYTGALLQMVNHGLISAALFLLAGAIERRTSTGSRPPSGRGRRDRAARGRAARALLLARGDHRARLRGPLLDGLQRPVHRLVRAVAGSRDARRRGRRPARRTLPARGHPARLLRRRRGALLRCRRRPRRCALRHGRDRRRHRRGRGAPGPTRRVRAGSRHGHRAPHRARFLPRAGT